MLTIYDDDDRIFEALCAGASGYLLKKTPPRAPARVAERGCIGWCADVAEVARRVVALFRAFRPPDDTKCDLTPHA
jgi:DNA-binding NarL/FixJ family response regulator